MEQAPRYIPDEELTAEQLAERNIAKAEAAAAAQSNASLVFNPMTGAVDPVEIVHSDLENFQGEQK